MSGIFGSTILEVAIGLFFTYFLLSILCSSINEIIAALTSLRARHLESGIAHLLRDPEVAQTVLQHPLVRTLDTSGRTAGLLRRFTAWYTGAGKAGFPSYIPARVFSLALFDALAPVAHGPVTVQRLRQAVLERAMGAPPAGAGAATGPVTPPITDPVDAERRALGTLLLNLIDASQPTDNTLITVDHVQAVIAHLPASTEPEQQVKAMLAAAADGAASLGVLRRRLLMVPDSPARQSVLAAVTAAEGDIAAARQSVETWFDQAMDRVSGIYKRRVQTILVLLALLISGGLGIDTLRLATTLAENTALRAALVNESTRLTLTSPPLSTPPTATPAAGAAPAQGPPTAASSNPPAGGAQDLSAVIAEIKQLSLPIGYDDYPRPTPGAGVSALSWLTWSGKKLLGLLATTFAITMGAPFWFDVLMKASNLRNAGPPPPRPSAPAGTTG